MSWAREHMRTLLRAQFCGEPKTGLTTTAKTSQEPIKVNKLLLKVMERLELVKMRLLSVLECLGQGMNRAEFGG